MLFVLGINQIGRATCRLKGAPVLKRVIVKQPPEVEPNDAEIYKMFNAHPLLECRLITS